ncbi:unnamed protein product [Owenia fusiformis]|uniref:Galactose-3-O-sulfotransferase 2-like n=1 Tax=Owenia fusiformis TaxID=6347 RepID=A0A8S4NA83_OWEFU|nr:unnamed protein product [Owenia fusiformis]
MRVKAVIVKSVILTVLVLFILTCISNSMGNLDLRALEKTMSKQIHDERLNSPEEHFKNTLDFKEQGSTPQQRLESNIARETKPRGIFHLKVYKAGSTTLQVMFNQYADKYDQIVGRPCSNSGVERHLVGWPEPFKPEHLIPLSKNTYLEHLNEHIKYSSKIKQVMAPGSVFVTSIREPVSHFYSCYNFYYMKNTYERYLKGPNKFKYFLNNVKTMPHLGLKNHIPSSNVIAQCFGIKQEEQYNIIAIQEKINEIEKEFDLVIVVEYLEESLILLTECSDLTIEDVVILRNANVRNVQKFKPTLTPNEYENLIQWNLADSMIYNHFNKTLWRKIDEFGRHNMALKIQELNIAKSLKQKECHSESSDLKIKHYCMLSKLGHEAADTYFRKKMTERGIYDIQKAQTSCKYPPGKQGE